eukprot:Hpha_TRINITY_DN13430_c0_g1::TRINITY_DN13430_c0_g1_i1::g.131076::m.131076
MRISCSRPLRRGICASGGWSRWCPRVLHAPFSSVPQSAWTLLGLRPGASQKKIRQAYIKLARQAHPDHGGSDMKMQELNAAYEQVLRGDSPNYTSTPEERTEHWANAGFAASQEQKVREWTQMYEDLPESMFLFRASGRESVSPPLGLRAESILVATPKAPPRYRGCVIRLVEVRGGAMLGYALNRQEPCSITDRKDWQLLKEHWGEMKEAGVGWGGPHGYYSHRVLVHKDDALAGQSSGTTRSAGGVHYDTDSTLAKRKRTVDRGKGHVLWGYCGWTPGVLDKAVRKGAWRVLAVGSNWPEGRDEEKMWDDAMKAPFYAVNQKPPSEKRERITANT